MEELALHVLDIAENSIAAGASRIQIRIRESVREDVFAIEVIDDGHGMGEAMLARATDPFFTSRTTRHVGLGLPLLEQAARTAGGELRIDSFPGTGTTVRAVFQHSHVDRQPLGDMAGTLLALVVGNPETDFEYLHQSDEGEFRFSSEGIKAQLQGWPVNSPRGIAAVRKSLAQAPG